MKRQIKPISVYDPGMTGPLEPRVEMEEQPQPHSIRFRYASEGNSHGGLQGVSSQRGNKTFPTIVIRNHHGPVKIVVELIAKDTKTKIMPHAHELIGKGCEHGVYSWKHMVDSPTCQIVFRHLSIQHVTKKTLVETLQRRLLMQRNDFLEGYEPKLSELQSVATEAIDLSKSLPMNSARLCFRVYLLDKHDRPQRQLRPAVSDPIFDAKSPSAALLKICRIDRHAGGCQGGDEVFLLCDRVQKGDIDVEFYEIQDGEIVWMEKALFTANDIHRQYAIVFTTPSYRDQNIEHPVDVFIRLYRPSDEEMSEPVKFTYRPNMERDELDRKRRKTLNFNLPDAMENIKPSRSTRKSAHEALNLPPGFFTQHDASETGSSRLQRRKLPSDVETDAIPIDDSRSESETCREKSLPLMTFAPTSSVTSDVIIERSVLIEGPPALATGNKSGSDNNSGTVLETALEKFRKQADTIQKLGSALHNYGISGQTRSLLSDLSACLNNANQDGDSPIGMAVIHGRTHAAINMVEVAAALEPDCLKHKNKLGQSLLHLCVIARRHEILRYLLGVRVHKANVYRCMDLPLAAQDICGNTFLHTAVRHREITALKALRSHLNLLKHNCSSGSAYSDVWLDTPNNEGFSAVHLAVRSGDLNLVEELCRLEPDINLRDQRSGFTPLHQAVVANDFAMTACLLGQRDVDVNMRCNRLQTPLHYTCWVNNPAMASLLLAGGADTTLTAPSLDQDEGTEDTIQVLTPMTIAMFKNHRELIALLNGVELLRVADDEENGDDLAANINAISEKKVSKNDLAHFMHTARHHLSAMLMTSEGDNDEEDWKILAEKLQLKHLIPYLRVANDPVGELLENFQMEGGKLTQLYKSVLEMQRFDIAYTLSCQFPEL